MFHHNNHIVQVKAWLVQVSNEEILKILQKNTAIILFKIANTYIYIVLMHIGSNETKLLKKDLIAKELGLKD